MNDKKSALSKMIEQHKKLAESFDFSMSKIDISIFESMELAHSSFATRGLQQIGEAYKKATESLAFGMPKIDASILEGIKSIQSSFALSGLSSATEQHKKVAKSLASVIPSTDLSIHEYLKSIQSLFPTSEPKQMLEEYKKATESLAFGMPKIDVSILESMKSIQKLFNNPDFLKIEDIYRQLRESLLIDKDFIENLNNFSKEFYVEDDLDFNIKYEDIEEINKKIENNVQLEKKDLITFDRIISVIALLFTFYVYFFPDNSEFTKIQKMSDKNFQGEIKTQQMIKKLDDKISKSLKKEKYYEVTKNVNVREQPNAKSKKIALVYSEQKLLIIENKLYWLQVEYFDEKRNETIIGWVSKKCTKRITNEL